MQNVGQETNTDNQKLDKVNAHEIGKSSTPQSSNSSPTKSDTDPYSEINPRFLSDSSESEDEEISEVDSFVIDQVVDIDENEARHQTSKFLLAQEDADHTVDPVTQARLEALLEAAGMGQLGTGDGKQLADPDVLRRLTSSVSCALDEAAAALTRMRSENPRPQPERSLVEACTDGDVGTVRKLLGEGRSVHETTEEGESLLSLACSAGYYELAQVLLAMHANVEDRGIKGDCTPLMEAASSGYVDIVRLLIHHGADVNAQSSSACAGNTPLMYACAGGHVEAVRVLLDAGANVEDHNENGHTPLMEAASAGHVPVAELLLERGAGINTHSNEFKESALTLACYKGHLDMVRFLLEAGADQEHKTDEMHTALMEASMDGHVEVARLLLDSGAQVNMPTDSFESPLTLAACGGHVHLALLLIERGANIEEVNDEGYTPLMEAAREGHEDMVAVLLEKGANINAQTEETQETALTLACCGGFLEVANFLIKNGAEIELGASTPLMEAAQEGHLELVRYLLEANADVNAQTQTGDTALTYSCENGHTEVARLLLQYGADLEHESEGGRTPLMKACRAGHLCTVKFLLSQNANVNKQTTNNDHTPLSLAAAGGHLAVVELLLSQSANPFHKLKDNSTMLIEAAKGGHTNVVQLLLDYPHSIMMRGNEQNGGTSTAAQPQTTATASSASSSSSSTSSSSGLHDVPDAVRALPADHAEPKPPALGRVNEQLPPVNKHVVTNQKSLLRKSRLTVVDPNTLTSPEVQQVRNQPGEGLLKDDGTILEKSIMKTPFSLETQFFQRQQIVEELQRVEQELKEKGAGALLEGPLSPTASAINNLLTPTTPPGPPPDTMSQGMVCGSTGVFHAAAQSGCTGQSLLVHGGGLAPTSNATLPPLPPLTPINSPGDVVQATAICDRPKAKPTWKKEGKIARKQAATFQQAIHHQGGPFFDPPTMQQFKHLVHKTDEITSGVGGRLVGVPPGSTSTTGGGTAGVGQATGSLVASAGSVGTGGGSGGTLQDPNKSVFTTNHIVAHIKQQLDIDIASPIHIHPAHDPSHSRSSQELGGVSGQCELMPRRCPLLSQGDEQTLIDLAKAGKLDQETLESFTLDDITEVVGERLRSSPNTESFLAGMEAVAKLIVPTRQTPFQVVPEVVSNDQTAAPMQYLYTTVPPTSAAQLPTSSTNIQQQQQQTPYQIQCQNDNVLPCGGAPSPSAVTAQLPPPPANATAAGSSLSTPNAVPSNQAQLHIKAPPPWVKAPEGSREQVQAGTQTSPAPPPEQNKKSVITATSTTGAAKGKKARYQLQQKSTQAPPIHPDNHVGYAGCDGQAGNGGPASISFCLDVDSATDSNNDTALTLACAGGHEELVELLLSRGANIEHRDKKGFTPLILAATAGHEKVVEILMNHSADMEAQSERTKDTPLSLACSGGRYEVVELLLAKGANKEHRNVSDYTPLSLAASGGYVNIIKLLLTHGAEINSRTGSKLGISPLMLAAMNGHTAAVKLLLDMGSDINAQIETNRNTALTLACFQGRHEVVSLLLDRRANVEHRAKTGLTPLMEAASGGYVEVGRVLLDKGADVNAPPVPSSRDTALTIAADKGHCRFVELLLNRTAQVEVKNKKGNSPLWLAANGGHLAVVELLYNAGADIDSQDNRKVSCLMAAFRKGHVKVVKWMVNHVMQFPSDQEMTRYISTVNDKELLEKCQECTKIIRAAKDQQAAKANKNATILLEELYMEKEREESKRAAAARKRERKKKKKLEKKEEKRKLQEENQKNERYANVEDEDEEENEEEDEKPEIKETKTKITNENVESVGGSESPGRVGPVEGEEGDSGIDANSQGSCSSNEVKGAGRRKEKKKKKTQQSPPQNTQIIAPPSTHLTMTPSTSKQEERRGGPVNTNSIKSGNSNNTNNKSIIEKQPNEKNEMKSNNGGRQQQTKSQLNKAQPQPPPQQVMIFEPTRHPADREDFEATGNELYHPAKSKKSSAQYMNAYEEVISNSKGGNSTSPKQPGKRDEGWKEVVRKYLNSPFKSKKVSVPLNAISRVIGRGGSNINAIRSATGAHIEVEKQCKGQGERIITLKGSPEATKQANSLIAALIKDPDVDILQILPKSAKSAAAVWEKSMNTAKSKPGSKSQSNHSVTASSTSAKTAPSTALNVSSTIFTLPRNSSNSVTATRVTAPRLAAAAAKRQAAGAVASTSTKTTMSYTSAIMTSSRNCGGNKPSGANQTFAAKLTSESNMSNQSCTTVCTSSLQQQQHQQQLQQLQQQQLQQQHQQLQHLQQQQQQQLQQAITTALCTSVNNNIPTFTSSSVISSGNSMPTPSNCSPTRPTSSNTPPTVTSSIKNGATPASPSPPPSATQLPTTTSQTVSPAVTPVSTALEYSLFNDTFTKVAQQSMWGRENDSQKGMNFASVAANGGPNSSVVMPPVSNKYLDPSPPQVDASKAPGYRGNSVCSPVSKGNTPSTSSSAVTAGTNYFPPHSESLSSFRPPPPPPSAYQQPSSELDRTTVPSFHPTSVAAMSRLNPRAPDFSTNLKPTSAVAAAAAACYLQQQPPPSAPPPPLMATNNNVISFKTVSRPNGQTRWPFLAGYAPATLAAIGQADLLGPLENGSSSNNVSPSSPQQQPQQPDDRKIPPRPIGTERAWKNYSALSNTSQELDMNPTWMMEPKMSWPGGPQPIDRHHLFRQTPNPVPFSRIPIPEDMQHIIDSPYQSGLDAQYNGGNVGGGMSVMHSLPAVMPHYNAAVAAAAAAAAAAASQDLSGAHPDTAWDQSARLPMQDLQPDKQHFYSTSQGWTKWSH